MLCWVKRPELRPSSEALLAAAGKVRSWKRVVPLTKGIRFDQVTFRYPGSDRLALRDFNLLIPAGKTVAIVGGNGAGKSTLIKLMCLLYDPEMGRSSWMESICETSPFKSFDAPLEYSSRSPSITTRLSQTTSAWVT
jgi:energy-coupling factor transporter ATP-binding protein EcfA2